jgi:transposase-like protein
MFELTNPVYCDADKARDYLEAIQWPNGPVCPHCGNVDQATIAKVQGKKQSHRAGLYYCNACKDQFTVTVGTVFERSHIPLNKWILASHLMAASKKGVSAHQLMRTLGLTYKSAWFMAHRLREAMKADPAKTGPMGGSGKIIEADETYIGRKEDQTPSKHRQGRPYIKRKPGHIRRTVVALVERGGTVRSFHVDTATKESVRDILVNHADPRSTLFTDESRLYTEVGKGFAFHDTVHHAAGEYARGAVHSNTIENVFSVFKRGMIGTYQHCGEVHLHRYLAEFDFRYNRRSALGIEDQERTEDLLRGAVGKRLTYRRIGRAQETPKAGA